MVLRIISYTRRATLLAVGLLVISSVLYCIDDESHASKPPGAGSAHLSEPELEQEQLQPHSTQVPLHGRRLQDLDAETQQHHMRSYLGGLYPIMDSSKLPLYLRDTLAPDNLRSEDILFFWHVPKASGSTVKNILNVCFNLKRAEQMNDTPSMDFVSDNVLNMDTSSPGGLESAFANQLASSGKVDVITSSYFLSGATLFTSAHQGSAFTIIRHPGEIALSLFHYRREATREYSHIEDFNQMSFRDYVSSDHYVANWMTRQLTAAAPWVELKESHLGLAKRVLKEKIFVGDHLRLDETFRQLKAHFGWKEVAPGCVQNHLHSAPINPRTRKTVEELKGGTTWKILMTKEKWDMSLYYYGLDLFAQQSLRYPPN